MIPELSTRPIPTVTDLAAARAAAAGKQAAQLDVAVQALRRGEAVVLTDRGASVAMLAADGLTARSLAWLSDAAQTAPSLILSAARAEALGVAAPAGATVVSFKLDGAGGDEVAALANPLTPLASPPAFLSHPIAGESAAIAAVQLAKHAALLPAAVIAPLKGEMRGLPSLPVADLLTPGGMGAYLVTRVSEATVPLTGAEATRIVAFRPGDGGPDHLALIIGSPEPSEPVLTRLHSSCLTGDLLGSLRCDCGDQLRGAIAAIAEAGSGVLLYLAQEGRGIGIANKLRAYALQDAGFDTLDANEQLGFAADERSYATAAAILRDLGFGLVRLLTNNPLKVAGLEAAGVSVAERVTHAFPDNEHNRRYLHTKATRAGHLF
jgi:GTP cyclohydrolase II